MKKNRIASCKRKTKETDIELTINLDGHGKNQIDTGIPFFDHMLDGFARHGLFDLTVSVKGRYRSRFPPYDRRYRDRAWSCHCRSSRR